MRCVTYRKLVVSATAILRKEPLVHKFDGGPVGHIDIAWNTPLAYLRQLRPKPSISSIEACRQGCRNLGCAKPLGDPPWGGGGETLRADGAPRRPHVITTYSPEERTKFALRFSTKALTASLWSSVLKVSIS